MQLCAYCVIYLEMCASSKSLFYGYSSNRAWHSNEISSALLETAISAKSAHISFGVRRTSRADGKPWSACCGRALAHASNHSQTTLRHADQPDSDTCLRAGCVRSLRLRATAYPTSATSLQPRLRDRCRYAFPAGLSMERRALETEKTLQGWAGLARRVVIDTYRNLGTWRRYSGTTTLSPTRMRASRRTSVTVPS